MLREGELQAGDEITRLVRGPEQLSIGEIDGLLYLPNRPRCTLQRALRIPALSDGWKGSFRSLLEQAEQAQPGAPNGATAAWTGFRALKVAQVRRESSTIVSLRLVATNGAAITPTLPGQYLTVRLRPGGEDQPPVIRPYSLSAVPGQDGYRTSVKLKPRGPAANSSISTSTRVT